jgi:CHAD domain-containing protein
MTLFRPTLKSDEYRPLRQELGWFARQLGEARNLDVLISSHGKSAPSPEIMRRRAEAYDHVASTLQAARVRSLFLRLAMWIEGGSWQERSRADREIGRLAEKRLDQQWKTVARRGPAIEDLEPEALHRLRVDVKKLRYSTEFLAGLHAHKPVSLRRNRFIAALKTLQERLGEVNDLQIDPALAEAKGSARGRGPSPAKLIKAAHQAFERASAEAFYWGT